MKIRAAWSARDCLAPRAAGKLLGYGAVASLLLLAACQHDGSNRPTVSLEEAKQITAEFSSGSFVPPPRSISDIIKLLDEQSPSDPAELKKRLAMIAERPPADAKGATLARFHFQRGRMAKHLGLDAQALTHLRRAGELADAGKVPGSRREIYSDLAWSEIRAGNYLDGIRTMEKAEGTGRQILGTQAGLTRMHARIGNLDKANKYAAETRSLIARGKGGAWAAVHRPTVAYVLLQAEGRYAEAEPHIRAAIVAFEGADRGKTFIQGLISRKHSLTRNLARQGRLQEAEVAARSVLLDSLSEAGKHSGFTANALRELVGILIEQGRLLEGEVLAREAIKILGVLQLDESSTWMTATRYMLGVSLIAQGKEQAALEEFERLRKGLEGSNRLLYDRWYRSGIWLPLALLGSGRAEEARAALADSHKEHLDRLGAKHFETAARGGLLAAALAQLGKRSEALARFSETVPILLSRSRQSAQEVGGTAGSNIIIGHIVEAYVKLLSEVRGTPAAAGLTIDPAAEAFRLANAARGRSVQKALAASASRSAASDPELADLARREQDARKQIAALYALLANVSGVPSDQQDPAVLVDLRTRIDGLRGARAALMEEIERGFPDYAQLINPKPATIEEARANLRPGEALIATYVGAERSFVWAVPRSGEVRFAEVPLNRERVAAVVTDLRRALDPRAATLGDIPAFDVALAHKLYRALLAPVEDGWKDARSLLIVADGPLGQLPFSLLPTERVTPGEDRDVLFGRYRTVPWLARDHTVTFLPSVASLATLRGLPAPSATRRAFVGFGDPWFSAEQAAQAAAEGTTRVVELTSRGILATRGLPLTLRSLPRMEEFDTANLAKLPRLPDTAEEIRSLALAMNADLTRDVFIGKAANEQTVKELNLSDYRVLAFATHGLVPGDLDGLSQPALALTHPEVAGVPGDGLLTLGEILSLRLDADWVVLSACNTAAGDGAGAEAVSGLGRAFFYAGTRALLVSNWPVETTSAKALTTDIFRRQAEDPSLSRAEALRQAMLGLMDGPGYVDDQGRTVFSYAHPIFWAPFTLIGDGGGSGPGA